MIIVEEKKGIIPYVKKEGAIPKDDISAKESSCKPISEYLCNIRAANPSRKSKRAANKIQNGAWSIFPDTTLTIAIFPHRIFNAVITFGIEYNRIGFPAAETAPLFVVISSMIISSRILQWINNFFMLLFLIFWFFDVDFFFFFFKKNLNLI